jgi:hypothetical protein
MSESIMIIKEVKNITGQRTATVSHVQARYAV